MSDILMKALDAQDELYHHGILGQKWGIRRYQNPDGSLTDEGRKRYSSDKLNADGSLNERGKKMLKDVSEQNYGPGNIFKRQKLVSAAKELNSNNNNYTIARSVVNSKKAIETYWDDLSTKYGMDPEDEGAAGSNSEILGRLSPTDQAYAKERLNAIAILENSINNYADHLAGYDATLVEKYRVQQALRNLDTYGVLDQKTERETGFQYVNRLLDNKVYNKKMNDFLNEELDPGKSFVDKMIAATNRLNMAGGSSGWIIKLTR